MTDEPRTIPADTGKCALHGYHSPRPQRLHIHHVFPLAWQVEASEANPLDPAGAEVDYGVVHVCPTGHDNVHALLQIMRAQYERGGKKLPYYKLREWGEAERDMAERGLLAWIEATGQLPPR